MLPCPGYSRYFVICVLFRMFHGDTKTSFTLGREIEEDFRSELDRPVPIESVSAVLNQRAQLPCDISIKDKDDEVSMVLWFRDSDGEPLYSFDLRNKNSLNAKPWSSPTVFKNRATFVAKTQPALLIIDSVTMEDETLYRCRVDFQNSPTRNSKVNLTVIEPPHLPVIFDDKKRDRSKVSEPFNEGSEITLYCEVTGGKPTPRLDWYLEEKLMYGESETRSSRVTVKRITIPSLSRDYQNKKLSCHASNTNLVSPATKYIILDINLKPLSMNITTKENYLSAGKLYNLECRCWGSKPPAHITWWIGSRQVNRETKTSLTVTNMNDISIMSFTPNAEDNGKYLTCRAENPSMENSVLEDKWHLNVQFSPKLYLKIGSSLNAQNIKEGDDVYFECNIEANPKIHKFDWFHNGMEITSNISNHVIKTDHNLILQTIKKSASGNFTCYGANVEGPAHSNSVTLNVKYTPICKTGVDEVYGALKQEMISLKCDVDANPPAIEFLWTFNNSGDMKSIHEPNVFTSKNQHLVYTPKTDSEFGTLSCRAKNIIGIQETACFFQIVAAGHPHPLLNCTINNITDEDLQASCTENFDGGLPQSFLMEVWEPNELQPKLNITTSQGPPIFNFHKIDTSLEYELRLYAVNQKGRSDAVTLRTSPLKGVAMYTRPLNFSFSSLTIILFLLGICSTILICVASIAMCRRRKKSDSHEKNENHNDILCHGAMLISDENVTSNHLERRSSSEDDPDPDLIPNIRERKVLKTFSKFQKTPPLRRHKKSSTDISEVEDDSRIDPKIYRSHCHLDKDSLPINRLLPVKGRGITIYPAETVVLKPAHNHKVGPEVVTASHRLQESCI